jgi:hypothetical protein
MVVGLGGVGSWVALDLALVGVPRLVLVDPDVVEASNLNRTPFKLKHVDMAKVKAVLELIYERRDGVDVLVFQKRLEDLSPVDLQLISAVDCVVDCRDILADVPAGLRQVPRIKLGYDGESVTIHFSPGRKVWGDEPVRYTTVPSFLVPPQLLAALTTYIVTKNLLNGGGEKVWSFTVRDVLKELGIVD